MSTVQIDTADRQHRIDDHEISVRVAARNDEAHGVVSLVLESVGGESLPSWEPGAHVDLVVPDGTIRQYSLCGDPDDLDRYRVGILREPNSRGGSRYLCDDLQVGDVLSLRGPRNNFPLQPSPRYLFIAGGIGITPLIPMIARAEAENADWRLIYGGRGRASMAFMDEVSAYGDRVILAPEDECGLLPLARILGRPEDHTLVYCCGPAGLLGAVEARCEAWPAGVLHLERFSARPQAAAADNHTFEAVLQQSGLTLTVEADQSIVELAEDAGVPVLYSCSEGTCGSCETPVLEGVPDHRDSVLSEHQRAANDRMMICVSRCTGQRIVLDL